MNKKKYLVFTKVFARLALFSYLLFSMSCAKQYHLADIKTRKYSIEKASYPVDTKIAAMIEPYKEQLDKTMNDVIGNCTEEMTKGRPSSTLTNWFGDVLLSGAQKLVKDTVDFAIQNYGGIRVPFVTVGPVTVGKIYELMPFDNILYLVPMKGAEVTMLFDKIAQSGGWPVSHTVHLEIEYGKIKNLTINGKLIDNNKTYLAAIPDYVANGGDNLEFLAKLPKQDTGKLLRDILIDEVKSITAKGGEIKGVNDNRIF